MSQTSEPPQATKSPLWAFSPVCVVHVPPWKLFLFKICFLRRRSTWFPKKQLYQISHHYFVLNHYITLNRDNMVTLTFSSSNRRFSGPRILGCFTGNFDRVLESEYSSSYSELALPFCWLKASWKCKSSGIKRRCMCGWIFWCYCNASWSLISKTALV